MNLLRLVGLCSGLAALSIFCAATAVALPVNNRSGSVVLDKNANEDGLQAILDDMTIKGGIDAVADQSNQAIFTSAGPDAIATFVVEVAGYSHGNEFGMYSYADPSQTVLLFEGSDTQSDQVQISFVADAVGTSVYVDGALASSGFGADFGFYIHTAAGDWFYTEDDRNGGFAMAVVYEGTGNAAGTTFDIGGTVASLDTGAVMIAFEDLPYKSSDLDYQDLVVIVDGVTAANPVPEPSAALLFSTALLLTAHFQRHHHRHHRHHRDR